MRILCVAPGHTHSTYDVYTGLCAGLEAHGVELVRYPLEAALEVNCGLHDLGKEHAPALAERFDPYAVAAHAIIGQAIWREVEAVIAVTGQNLHFGAVGTLRKAGILTALVCTESPYLTLERERHDARFYDVVFTNDKNAVELFGRPAVYLPAACNPAVHTKDGPHAPPSDVFFIGTAFDERRELFAGVDWTGINTVFMGGLWQGQGVQLVDNQEVAPHYRSSLINLNHHRTTMNYQSGQHIRAGLAYSLGPRAYEIAACGGFQLMDDSRPEAKEVFGTSLATYRAGDGADLERQIRWWLAHPQERAQFAAEQHRCIQPHSWTARAGAVLDALQEHTWQPSMA